jgi:hypothetical protein
MRASLPLFPASCLVVFFIVCFLSVCLTDLS